MHRSRCLRAICCAHSPTVNQPYSHLCLLPAFDPVYALSPKSRLHQQLIGTILKFLHLLFVALPLQQHSIQANALQRLKAIYYLLP